MLDDIERLLNCAVAETDKISYSLTSPTPFGKIFPHGNFSSLFKTTKLPLSGPLFLNLVEGQGVLYAVVWRGVSTVDLSPDNVEELLLPAFNVLDTDEFVVRGIPSS